MKSRKFKHIFASCLFIFQIRVLVCQSQIQELNSSPYNHKYAFATSYAWKFQFPVTYPTAAQDTSTQWRPVVRYSQEQLQFPNEYLIASNYPGSSVKNYQNQQPGQKYPTLDNQGQYQPIVFPTQSQTAGQQPQYSGTPQNHQIFRTQTSETLTPTPSQGQPIAIQVPLLNDKGQQIGWQFYHLPKQYQQPGQQINPIQQYGQQPIVVYLQPDHIESQTITPSVQPVSQGHQIIPIAPQSQQPITFIPGGQQIVPISTTQGQQFNQPYPTVQQESQQIITDGRQQVVGAPHQGCIGQPCQPTSSVLYPTVANSYSSTGQIQEINQLLQNYQQNLLQALMSHMQQATLGQQASSNSYPVQFTGQSPSAAPTLSSNDPIAVAGATISDTGSGTSHLNSFTYTKA